MPSRTYDVDGVESDEDENALVAALKDVPGVERVVTDRGVNELTVEGDAEDKEVRRAISMAGFRKGGL
jgi:copper chaperone CopZ